MLEFQQRSSQFPCDQKKINDANNILDGELLNLTVLYEKYAIPFDLFEIKLDILQCAGHYEKNVVEDIWKSILDRGLIYIYIYIQYIKSLKNFLELFNYVNCTETESTARGKLGTIICKLRKHFLRSPKFVPIGLLHKVIKKVFL